MNTEFLQDRAATIGQKLAAYLVAGKIPNQQDVDFFNKCMSDLEHRAPAHAMRTLAIQLHQDIDAAKAKRALWLTGRAEAAKAADQRKAAKVIAVKAATTKAKKCGGRSRKTTGIVNQVISEIKARRAAHRAEYQARLRLRPGGYHSAALARLRDAFGGDSS